jgi:hypothetical protein
MAKALIISGTDTLDAVSQAPAFVQRPVYNGAARTLTANDNGALCLFDLAAGFTYTLPTPAPGLWFEFQVTVTVTSVAAKILTPPRPSCSAISCRARTAPTPTPITRRTARPSAHGMATAAPRAVWSVMSLG